ncbi:MAG: recombinase RecA [Verrucomicrobia bacterium]|nr:recombinase RecA [Verrucomicrobiota bacterium]
MPPKSTEKTSDKSEETPVEKPADKAADKPVEKSAEKAVEKATASDKKAAAKSAEPARSGDTRSRELEAAISSITKTYGEGSIMRLGEAHAVKIDVISTGSLAVDLALGVGGIPRGRIIEIYGPESSGKTTLMLHVIANAQKNGGIAAFIDAEHALDPGYAKRLGVNLDNLLISQPDSGEEALSICETLARSNSLDVIVVDSVAALVPKAELEGEMGMATMGMQARLMSQALRKLTAILSKAKTTCVFTNQMREKVGVMFGSPETTSGGKALKFYASVRIDIRRKEAIKNATGSVIGNRAKVKIVKNKVAPPFTEAEFDIYYNQGINKEGNIVDVGIDHGVLDKRGAWIQFQGELIGQGKDAARQSLVDNPDVAQRIIAAILEKRAAA